MKIFIPILTFLFLTSLSLICTSLNCDDLNFSTDYSHKPGDYEAWLNTLPEGYLKDFKTWCDQNDEDYDDLHLDLYAQYRFEKLWNQLTPEQQEQFYNHNKVKTRIWGGIFVVVCIIISILIEND